MITLPPDSGTIQYRFINDDLRHLQILAWDDTEASAPAGVSTASPSVSLLSPAFVMPQLGRSRRIWLYLPPGYDRSDRAYPVLYMHDGQNLFDKLTGFANQEWEVDDSLDRLVQQGDPGCIVVAIDNGSQHRINEYSPYPFQADGHEYGGEGNAYVDFIVQTLKPYIDTTYRTLSDRDHTGIAGSSMGGLISHYAAIKYPEIFGRIGIFSPSYWISERIFADARATGHPYPMRIYLLAGENEGGSMVPKSQAMYDTLREVGFGADELLLRIVPGGQHSEWFWRQEFPAAYQWLFHDGATSEVGETMGAFRTMHQPHRHVAHGKARLDLYNMMGVPVMNAWIEEGDQISIAALPEGIYLMRIEEEGKIYYERFVKD